MTVIANYDQDRDSQIFEAEFVAQGDVETGELNMAKRFKEFDADQSGFVTYAEFNARFTILAK